ncbi:MAG: hypothetical protein K0R39_3288 [Symbiobacteriaceae bacterium]|jgi:hypothetical protein|nr:hypothetical protein [Symbiobacteriaceae bacterium]
MRSTARRPVALLIAILLLLLSLPVPAFGAEPTGTVNVLVETTDGQPVTDVAVKATALTSRYSLWQPNSGGGAIRPLQLPPGQYKVAVSALGYEAPATQIVTVAASETQTLTFVVAVLANPGRLSGQITDQSTGDPIKGRIAVKLTRQGDGVPSLISVGEDGAFSVPSIEPGTYTATTNAISWEAMTAYITEDRLVWVTVSPGAESRADLTVSRKGTVKAQISTSDGSKVKDVQLVLTDAQNANWTFYADAGGNCTATVAPGLYSVRAAGPAYKASPVQWVTVTAGRNVTLTFQVEPVPAGAVRGRVVDRSGAPMADAHVYLSDDKNHWVGQGVRTDADGIFAFPPVAPGTYVVMPYAEGYVAQHPSTVKVEVGQTATTEVTMTREVLVRFRVVDEAGQVFPRAALHLEGKVLSPERDPEGNLLLLLLEGEHDVAASARWYQQSDGQRVMADAADGQQIVTIQLKPLPTGTITGKVTNLVTGAPVPEIPVELVDPGFLQTVQRTVAAKDGTFTFTDVPIGRYIVLARGSYDEGQMNDVRVNAGESTTAAVEVRSYGRLVVRVQDSEGKKIPGATVRLSRVGSGVWNPYASDLLGVVSQFLEVGTYRMTVTAPGYRSQVVHGASVERGLSTSVVVTMEGSK